MIELTKMQKIIIGICIIVILIVIGIFLYKRIGETEYSIVNLQQTEEIFQNEVKEKTNKIKVHVTGYVEEEGIVELEEGARIADAIEAAGGATLEAELSKLNLAYVLKDGQKIYIPSILDEEEEYIMEGSGDGVIKEEEEQDKEGKININTATQTELETLTGIGPSTASKIIEYRKQNGEFKTIEDIKNVSGIGENKYESIKNNICV